MGKLMDFLLNNQVEDITEEITLSERLKGFKFVIKAIPSAGYDDYIARARKDSSMKDRKAETALILDYCVEPNFRDKEALKQSGCKTPYELIDKTLKIGEQKNLYLAISKLSGFESMEAQVERVKN